MRKFFALFPILLLPFHGLACLNEYRAKPFPENSHEFQVMKELIPRHFDYAKLQSELEQMNKEGLKNYEDSSDAAVLMVKTGTVFHALTIFQRLSLDHPGEYTIAANLGTTYELVGENDSALKYIRKGMQLNPRSHAGSEWVHERILLAKLALRDDPDWLKTHSVLNLSNQMFREKLDWTLGTGRGISQIDTALAIKYQLKERIPFTAAPDLIMCSIVSDLAAILQLGTPKLSLRYFTLADEYADEKNNSIHSEKLQLRKLIDIQIDKSMPGELAFITSFDPEKAYRITDGNPQPGPEIKTATNDLSLYDEEWQRLHPKKNKDQKTVSRHPRLKGFGLAALLVLCTAAFLAIKRREK